MISNKFKTQGAITTAPVSGIPCLVDVCSAGEPGTFYAFNPGDNVGAQIGGGRGADLVYALLSLASSAVYFTPAAPTYSALPSIVHVGSGPAVSVALVPGTSGAMDDHTDVITITQGGTNNASGGAQMAVAYDGATQIDTLPVPTESPATLVGTATITPTVLALAAGLTLVFAQPAAETITFASPSLPAAPAALLAATATSSSPITVLAAGMLAAGIASLAANPRKISFTSAGTTADVPATAAVTGFDYAMTPLSETVVPDTSAGTVFTAHAYMIITSVVYSDGSGTAGTISIGIGAAYASIAEMVSEFNALAIAAPIGLTAYSSQSGAGAVIAVYTNLPTSGAGGTGLSAVVTMNASAGTGSALLGFANSATATGLPATFAPPWTNRIYTFPVGAYVQNETYTLACAGPEASISAIAAAVAVAQTNWRNASFGFIAVTAPPSSAANAATLQATVSGLLGTSRTSNQCPVIGFTGTPLHAASQVASTNQAGITANDNAINNAFSSNPAALDAVGVDDCYVAGASALRAGSYRRSAVFAMAARAATLGKLGDNLGGGVVPGISLRAPDLLTLARDESTSVVKLGPTGDGNTGAGFCVLMSGPAGLGAPQFVSGITRAGSSSYYRSVGVVLVALEIAQMAFGIAFPWQGQMWPVSVLPGTAKQMEPKFAANRAGIVKTALRSVLQPNGTDNSTWAVSYFDTSIITTGDFLDAGQVPLSNVFVPLGEVFDVQVIVTATGTVITATGPAGTQAAP